MAKKSESVLIELIKTREEMRKVGEDLTEINEAVAAWVETKKFKKV